MEQEILALKVRLQRLQQLEMDNPGGVEVLSERIEREGGNLPPVERKYSRRDTTGEILRIVSQIEKLQTSRQALLDAAERRTGGEPVTEIRLTIIGEADET